MSNRTAPTSKHRSDRSTNDRDKHAKRGGHFHEPLAMGMPWNIRGCKMQLFGQQRGDSFGLISQSRQSADGAAELQD